MELATLSSQRTATLYLKRWLVDHILPLSQFLCLLDMQDTEFIDSLMD